MDLINQAERDQHYSIVKSQAHYDASVRSASINRWLGIAAIVSTAFVGTSIFANAAKDNPAFAILLGLISFLAAALSGMQTFLKYTEEAQLHKTAASGYEKLRAELELYLLRYADQNQADHQTALADFEKIKMELVELEGKSPTISDKIYDAAAKKKQSRPPTSTDP